jgi:peptidoglycan lytic transglycosylase
VRLKNKQSEQSLVLLYLEPRLLILKCVGLLFLALLLHGCGSSSSSGGYGYGDGPPPKDIDVRNLPDAVPKVEPIRKAGNKSPYTVLGKTYQVLPSSIGFRERGIASWYGNKFHGRKTSNGEIYNMYAMTAAHKNLPIPCYVKVTNLDNGRTVIVRVNDRGPFHGGRIIDLSYAAAKKLDYSSKGTANVEVVAINARDFQKNQAYKKSVQKNTVGQPESRELVVNSSQVSTDKTYQLPGNELLQPEGAFLQVGAFSSEVAAKNLSERVQRLSSYPVVIRQLNEPNLLFKVLVGPVKNNLKLLDLRNLLRQTENLRPFVVYE